MAEAVVRAVHGGAVVSVQLPPDATRAFAVLSEAGRELTGAVRVVVVCAPAGGFGPDEGTPSEGEFRRRHESVAWLRRPDLISIAAVRGPAFGAALQLVLACDFRVLADDAVLAVTEVQTGSVPGLGSTRRFLDAVGPAVGLELMITGRRLTAAQAVGLRLANLAVPADQLDPAVADLVAAVLAAPRDAVTEAKALLAASGADDLTAALRLLDAAD